MDKARSDIREVLRSRFGDDSLLFVSLWNTVEYERNELDVPSSDNSADVGPECSDQTDHNAQKDMIDWRRDAYYTLNCELTGHKLAAFSWIEQGMNSLH